MTREEYIEYCKTIAGASGGDSHTVLYGVKDGKPVEHFAVKGRFEKENRFLRVCEYYGGEILYSFDETENEYRQLTA